MDDCVFCKIINKKIDAKIIFEDENVIAFLDAFPKAKGHTLIVPKKHYDNILQKEKNIDPFLYVDKVINELNKDYDFEDFKILSNVGKKAGQEVFHTHVHIIPYY